MKFMLDENKLKCVNNVINLKVVIITLIVKIILYLYVVYKTDY